MSYARSPRLVCSTTMGTSAMAIRSPCVWFRGGSSGPGHERRFVGCLFLGHLCVLEEEVENLASFQHVPDPAAPLLGRQRPELLRHPAAGGEQLAQLLADLGIRH